MFLCQKLDATKKSSRLLSRYILYLLENVYSDQQEAFQLHYKWSVYYFELADPSLMRVLEYQREGLVSFSSESVLLKRYLTAWEPILQVSNT